MLENFSHEGENYLINYFVHLTVVTNNRCMGKNRLYVLLQFYGLMNTKSEHLC